MNGEPTIFPRGSNSLGFFRCRRGGALAPEGSPFRGLISGAFLERGGSLRAAYDGQETTINSYAASLINPVPRIPHA